MKIHFYIVLNVDKKIYRMFNVLEKNIRTLFDLSIHPYLTTSTPMLRNFSQLKLYYFPRNQKFKNI